MIQVHRQSYPSSVSGKRIALTLGSGGARGYAHIGVIEELLARGYEITAIAGCSMGALVGGIYAAGQLDAYRQWSEELSTFGVLRLLDVTFGAMGAMHGKKVMGKIESFIGDIQIEDLPMPFTAVATDLVRQREVWFQRGSLLKAIRASIAIPGVFTPVEDDARFLVDGGLLNPLPILSTVSGDADLMMAVNATAINAANVTLRDLLPEENAEAEPDSNPHSRPSAKSSAKRLLLGELRRSGRQHSLKEASDDIEAHALNDVEKEEATHRLLASVRRTAEADRAERGVAALGKKEWSRLAMILMSFDVTQAALARYKIAGCPPDILVEIPKSVCGSFEFHRAHDLIRLGRHLTSQALDRLERYTDG